MRLSRTEVAALAFGACSVALAFPIAWESHLMNRCISTLQQELRDNQPKRMQRKWIILFKLLALVMAVNS